MKTEKFNVSGMTCAACQANVTKCVAKIDGVDDVNVNLMAGSMTVSYDESRATSDAIADAGCAIGYETHSAEQSSDGTASSKKAGSRTNGTEEQGKPPRHVRRCFSAG